MRTIDDLVALLRDEPNAAAYGGDAADMIRTGVKYGEGDPLAGPLQIARDMCSEVDCLHDGTGGLEGQNPADDLDDIARTLVRAAHLALHGATAARSGAAQLREAPGKRAAAAARTLRLPFEPGDET